MKILIFLEGMGMLNDDQFFSAETRDAKCSSQAAHMATLLGDAPLRPTFPPIFLHHLCIFLLIIASPRRSALVALTPESNDHVT